MKIDLIFAPVKGKVSFPPMSIASLAGMLIHHKYKVDVYDFNKKLAISSPDLYSKIVEYFATPSSLTKKISGVTHSYTSIDTIYNINLLLFALNFSEGNSISENEKDFLRELDKRLEIDCANLLAKSADIIGFSVYVSNIAYSCLLAQKLKKSNYNLKIIFGGPSISYRHIKNFLLKSNLADSVVIGEGEFAILDAIHDIKNNQLKKEYFGDNNTFTNGQYYSDLDNIPFPEFSKFDLSDYSADSIFRKKTVLPINASRGCVGKCKYCSETTFWKNFRQRSVESVIREIKLNISKYNANHFVFTDSLLNGNRRWLNSFCEEIISQKIAINWTCYCRIIGMDNDLLNKMKLAGCQQITYGVEHVSKNVLGHVNKRMSSDKIIAILKHTYSKGILVVANFIYGFPHEDDSDFLSLLYFLLRPEVEKHILCTFRPYELRVNSDFFSESTNLNLIIKSQDIKISDNIKYLEKEIRNINIIGIFKTPHYYEIMSNKSNILINISRKQEIKWGNFGKWIKNFTFPEEIEKKLKPTSTPKIHPRFIIKSINQSNRIFFRMPEMNNLEEKIFLLSNGKNNLQSIATEIYRTTNKKLSNNVDKSISSDMIYTIIVKASVRLTLREAIQWPKL